MTNVHNNMTRVETTAPPKLKKILVESAKMNVNHFPWQERKQETLIQSRCYQCFYLSSRLSSDKKAINDDDYQKV